MDRLKALLFKRLSSERADWTFSAMCSYATGILVMFLGCLALGRLNLPEGLLLLYFLVFAVVAIQFILMALIFNLMGLVFDANEPAPASDESDRMEAN